MKDHRLSGHSIMIVDDHLVVAMDLAMAFEDAGAKVVSASNLSDAMALAESLELSGAVVDFGLGNEVSDALFGLLNTKNVPFVLHSGNGKHGPAGTKGIVISKPANPQHLIDAIASAMQVSA